MLFLVWPHARFFRLAFKRALSILAAPLCQLAITSFPGRHSSPSSHGALLPSWPMDSLFCLRCPLLGQRRLGHNDLLRMVSLVVDRSLNLVCSPSLSRLASHYLNYFSPMADIPWFSWFGRHTSFSNWLLFSNWAGPAPFLTLLQY